jgi:hypothetical protein
LLLAQNALQPRLEPFVRGRDARVETHGSERLDQMLTPIVYVQMLDATFAARTRRRLAGERAQGTVEYVALVTLVAIVMVGVIAALKGAKFAEGQELGSLILKKIADAVSSVKY